MGSDYNTSGAMNPNQVIQNYARYIPTLTQQAAQQGPGVAAQQLQAANEQMNPSDPIAVAQRQIDAVNRSYSNKDSSGYRTAMASAQSALADAQARGTPLGYNALNLQQMQRYALPEAQVGQQVADSNAQAGARTNLAQITGAGGQAATAATALNRQLNPGFYTASDAASKGAADTISNINLKGLSPGESNAVERSLNQTNTATGNLGLVNPMNTISNAMNFGGAYNAKLGLMNNAVGAASQAAQASGASGINPVSVALGQPNVSTMSNFGSGQFTNTNPSSVAGAAGNAFNFGSGTMNSLTSGNNAAQASGATMAGQSSPVAVGGSIGSNM